jgi:hypothetical protein
MRKFLLWVPLSVRYLSTPVQTGPVTITLFFEDVQTTLGSLVWSAFS